MNTENIFSIIGFGFVMLIAWFLLTSVISFFLSTIFCDDHMSNLSSIFPWIAYVVDGICFAVIMSYIYVQRY